jgi:hypothetical protein
MQPIVSLQEQFVFLHFHKFDRFFNLHILILNDVLLLHNCDKILQNTYHRRKWPIIRQMFNIMGPVANPVSTNDEHAI